MQAASSVHSICGFVQLVRKLSALDVPAGVFSSREALTVVLEGICRGLLRKPVLRSSRNSSGGGGRGSSGSNGCSGSTCGGVSGVARTCLQVSEALQLALFECSWEEPVKSIL
jgi:hypothetical protein